jgi:hypothetical protein
MPFPNFNCSLKNCNSAYSFVVCTQVLHSPSRHCTAPGEQASKIWLSPPGIYSQHGGMEWLCQGRGHAITLFAMHRSWVPQDWHDFVGGVRGFLALSWNHTGVGSVIEAWEHNLWRGQASTGIIGVLAKLQGPVQST